jgi:hypothetical protein
MVRWLLVPILVDHPNEPSWATGSAMTGDFEDRVKRAQQQQAINAARAGAAAEERKVLERNGAEMRRLQLAEARARQESVTHISGVVAAALAAQRIKGDVWVLDRAGRAMAAQISTNISVDPKSGPVMFGIPNLLRDWRRRTAARHRAPAWCLGIERPDATGRPLLLTGEGDLVESGRAADVKAADGVVVRFAAGVAAEDLVSEETTYSAVLDGLATLVARQKLPVQL